jgi:hypothetical protein
MAKVIIIDDALRDQFAALSSRQPSLSPPSPATEAAAAAALVSSPVALHSRSSLSSEASPTSVADVAATGAAAGRGRLLKFRLPCDSSDRLFLLKGGFLYELQQASCGDKTSWFMDDAVVQDGSFFSATPFQACSV